MESFVELQKTLGDSKNSWKINVNDLDSETFDLSVKNPNKKDDSVLREPKDIIEEIGELDKKLSEILKKIKELV